jgi:PAS domain S-box-containing protein
LSPSPTSPADLALPLRDEAGAAFDPELAPQNWRNAKARLAIVSPPARVVAASAAMLDLFRCGDLDALDARLVQGDGPSARRLRHLAATLPIGQPPRLERMSFVIDRRPSNINLRCAQVSAPGDRTWLLASIPALGAASVAPLDEPLRDFGRPPPPKARFLWALDGEGRFGVPHPALSAALGVNAPRPNETVEALLGRADLEGGDELVRAFAARQTFSNVTLGWPLAGSDRRRQVALSAAPVFGRHREFLGYRGFGMLGELIDSAPPREAELTPDLAEEVFPQQAATFEPRLPPDAALCSDGSDVRPGAASPADEPGALSSSEAPAPEEGLVFAAPDSLQTADEPPSRAAGLPWDPEDEALPPELASLALGLSLDAAPPIDKSDTALETAKQAVVPPAEIAPGDGPVSAASDSLPLANEGTPHDEPSTKRAAAGEARPASIERTAEVYVLRQLALAATSKIVPIRAGALEALAAREAPQGSPAESIELSRSERDAFREIARSLIGRPQPARDDRNGENGAVKPAAGARGLQDGLQDMTFGPAAEPTTPDGELAARAGVGAEEVRRNAGAVLDRLPIGVLVVRDARALYANRTLLDLVGYRDFAEFQAAGGLAAMFRDRDPQEMTSEAAGAVPIVRADGESVSVDGHVQAIGLDGAAATLIALRRSPEAELAAKLRVVEREAPMRNGSARDLQEMLDRATDGAVTLDLAGRILSLNLPAERLFGYDQKEIAGESVLMLLAPQSHPEATARLESLSREGESGATLPPLEVVGRGRSGSLLPLALTLARIGPSEAPHFCALMRDLSREREADRRLIATRDAAEAASAAKTDFLAQVSHEIRTPLHAILGFAEVMMEERFGPLGNERYKDYLKDIHASGSHVMSLADDLLDLSKIEAGKLELAFAPVDANSLIRECVSLMQPQAARERVIMRVSLHDRLPRVMVDKRSLRQIMLNLISNAVKFNEPGGQVIVSTAVDAAGQAVIRVRDTGVGMNEAEVGLALAPFSQVGKANGKGGAGLGLPLTKALVEANKAEFSIKSRREQGTLIEIAFPNVQAAE